MTYENIIRDFDEHISKSYRESYGEFYIGITSDIENRLFVQHRVDREKQWRIYSPADTEDIAREVERHYLDLGMQGGAGGGRGDDSAIYVYCYVITSYTIEK